MTVHTVEAKTARVTVPRDLPALAEGQALASSASPRPLTSGAVTTVTSAPSDATRAFPQPVVESAFSPQRIGGWALAGVGAIGAGVGIGFGLASIGDRNDSRAHCAGDLCDADGVRMRDDAIRHGTIATVSMLAGGAAIAGGIVLVLTAPRGTETPEPAGKVRAMPNVARGGGGLLLEGDFQ
jgi:hypothetical protein